MESRFVSILFVELLLVGVLATPAFAQDGRDTCSVDIPYVTSLLVTVEDAQEAGDYNLMAETAREMRRYLRQVEVGCGNWGDTVIGSNRLNPIPFNYQQSLIPNGALIIQVTKFVSSANDVVAEANMFNKEPAADERWVTIELTLECDLSPEKSCTLNAYWFKVVGSSGKMHAYTMMFGGFETEVEVFGQGSAAIVLPFMVGADETDIVLVFDSGDLDRVFWSTE